MRRTTAIGLLTVAAALAAGPDVARAAPAELKGKSVSLRWTETRIQRTEGHSDFRTVNINLELAIYVSTEGRVFNKMQSNSGANEQAPGDVNRSGRVPSFSGRTMTVMQPLRGLARRIVVQFGGDFSSCTATVAAGKQSGSDSGTIRAFGTGTRQEVKSVSTSGVSCSVKAGNVFQ